MEKSIGSDLKHISSSHVFLKLHIQTHTNTHKHPQYFSRQMSSFNIFPHWCKRMGTNFIYTIVRTLERPCCMQFQIQSGELLYQRNLLQII